MPPLSFPKSLQTKKELLMLFVCPWNTCKPKSNHNYCKYREIKHPIFSSPTSTIKGGSLLVTSVSKYGNNSIDKKKTLRIMLEKINYMRHTEDVESEETMLHEMWILTWIMLPLMHHRPQERSRGPISSFFNHKA